jgi:hypothetical protein
MRIGSRREPSTNCNASGRHWAGLLATQERQHTVTVYHNAQRLLRPLLVVTPYAESLTFLDDKARTRRDHLKYLTLIRDLSEQPNS